MKTNLEFFNLLFDSSQISSHSRHVTQLDHCVVQVVKHRLEMKKGIIVINVSNKSKGFDCK